MTACVLSCKRLEFFTYYLFSIHKKPNLRLTTNIDTTPHNFSFIVSKKALLNMTKKSSPKIVISGSGVWTPSNIITNEELAESYNTYAEKFNSDHA
jgi:hypothetical protein